jgi:fatty acid desaturase
VILYSLFGTLGYFIFAQDPSACFQNVRYNSNILECDFKQDSYAIQLVRVVIIMALLGTASQLIVPASHTYFKVMSLKKEYNPRINQIFLAIVVVFSSLIAVVGQSTLSFINFVTAAILVPLTFGLPIYLLFNLDLTPYNVSLAKQFAILLSAATILLSMTGYVFYLL